MVTLEAVAYDVFGLQVQEVLPVEEGFSSRVLRFLAADGLPYVVKQPWAANKAVREADALVALLSHPHIPALLGHEQRGDASYLLIEGLDGSPWPLESAGSPALVRDIGLAMSRMHSVGRGCCLRNWTD